VQQGGEGSRRPQAYQTAANPRFFTGEAPIMPNNSDLHIIFSTKNRERLLIGTDLQKALHAYMGATMKQLDCMPVEIGGVDDHVHILCLFPRTRSVADVVKETKRVSTNWLQEQGPGLTDFHWQAGYGVFSVSQSGVDDVVEYIRRQEEHHRKLTFQDEYRAFLKKHAVDFDERYVWD
jgi:REP element-mobilizing transposase RayT